jgi:pimeloyl-ACP methyl ester carboxylesterase
VHVDIRFSPNRRIAYTDWGPLDAAETVVCVSLTRQGRDFDLLARSLATAGFRVVCPDLVGRGLSAWLPNVLDYVFPQYCADMATLLAALSSNKVHWIGTSLGGIIGIILTEVAWQPDFEIGGQRHRSRSPFVRGCTGRHANSQCPIRSRFA